MKLYAIGRSGLESIQLSLGQLLRLINQAVSPVLSTSYCRLVGREVNLELVTSTWYTSLTFCSPTFSNMISVSLSLLEIPLAPMGVLAPVSVHAGPSAQPPINVSGNFPAHVSAELPSNISPNPSEDISEVSELYKKSFRIYLK